MKKLVELFSLLLFCSLLSAALENGNLIYCKLAKSEYRISTNGYVALDGKITIGSAYKYLREDNSDADFNGKLTLFRVGYEYGSREDVSGIDETILLGEFVRSFNKRMSSDGGRTNVVFYRK